MAETKNPQVTRPPGDESKGNNDGGRKDRITDSITSVVDEFSRVAWGFLSAGVEAVRQTGELAQTFLDKTSGENDKEERKFQNFPKNVADGAIDTLEQSASSVKNIIKKFNKEYDKKG